MRARGPRDAKPQRLRWAARSALLTATVGTLAGAGPASAAGPAACGLTVLSSGRAGAGDDVLVSVPRSLSQIDLPATAFSASRGGQPVQVSVQPRTGPQPSVEVVIASSAKTAKTDFDRAREGALEFLVGLPDGTRTAAMSTGQQAPLASLSESRARTTRSLEQARPGAGTDSPVAVRRAARELPPGGHVVLFTDGTADGAAGATRAAALELRSRGVVLDRVGYLSATASDRPGSASLSGCESAAAAVLPQVDGVLATIRGQYRLRFPTTPVSATRLTVRFADITSSAVLPAPVPSGTTRAVAYPYADTRFPFALSSSLYTAAGLLGLLGLLLVTRRRPWGRGTSMSPP